MPFSEISEELFDKVWNMNKESCGINSEVSARYFLYCDKEFKFDHKLAVEIGGVLV